MITEVSRRNEQLAATLRERLDADPEPVAAIEIAAPDAGRREADLRIVRGALTMGLGPRSLGLLFVAVLADLTYEVDWKDHFRFWPILGQHLGAVDLGDFEHRRAVADAFREFARAHRGVAPAGALAEHFPLMAWPLVHAVLPRCAQRAVGRVLERAAALGRVPADARVPWPAEEIREVAGAMSLPAYVAGLLENPSVLARGGRAMLGSAVEGAPTWVARLRGHVEADAVTRALVDDARANLRRGAAARSAATRHPLPLGVGLDLGAEARPWISLGPLDRTLAAHPEVLALARAGAQVRARVDGASQVVGPLFNALAAPLHLDVAWKSDALSIAPSIAPYEGEDVPEALAGASTPHEPLRLPIVLRREDDERFVHRSGRVALGERVAILARRAWPLAPTLRASGMDERPVAGSPALVALVGEVGAQAAEALSTAGVATEEHGPTLVPFLTPVARREHNRLVYRPGRDVWMRLERAPNHTLAATLASGDARREIEIGTDVRGATLMRIPAEALPEGRHEVRIYAEGRARALASADLLIERDVRDARRLARWRAALHPRDASLEHLLASQCWIELELLPGAQVEVEVSLDGRRTSAMLGAEERNPFRSAKSLREMVAAALEGHEGPVVRASLRARASDEPDTWVPLAELGDAEAVVRFGLDEEGVRVDALDDAPALTRIEFSRDGLRETAAARGDLAEPGVYLARVGAARAALCVERPRNDLPRLPRAERFARSLTRAVDLLATLRAVDIASLAPVHARTNASLLRRAAANAIERELVGGLCGAAWARTEDALARERRVDGALDPDALARTLAPLLWLDAEGVAGDLDASEEPFDLLRALLARAGEPADDPRARHLVLAFYQRGMASPREDRAALEWAWASTQRARIARTCFLADPLALVASMAEGGEDAL